MKMQTENYIKNGLATILAALIYPYLKSALSEVDTNSLGDFLLVISVLLVTVSFANFAFTYEASNKRGAERFLSHAATFLFIFLIATALEAMVIAFRTVYPSLHIFVATFSILLYLGIILYDIWDYKRVKNRH